MQIKMKRPQGWLFASEMNHAICSEKALGSSHPCCDFWNLAFGLCAQPSALEGFPFKANYTKQTGCSHCHCVWIPGHRASETRIGQSPSENDKQTKKLKTTNLITPPGRGAGLKGWEQKCSPGAPFVVTNFGFQYLQKKKKNGGGGGGRGSIPWRPI